ncbi:MAG: 23S rRNA (guanosine(2251)-2'-O)-methyltransferase RlmB [Deltaproteobacteria bacterium]|nr:MAG: 23S rRNA (guanosine(2251)-2'-O)-methyltransferase RlmB [Deltaproteobacteria bacterium]
MKKKQPAAGWRSGEKRIRLSDDLLWGVHPVYEALLQEADRCTEILLVKDKRGSKIEEIIALARDARIKCTFVDSLKLVGESSASIRHQGVVARLSAVPLYGFEAFRQKMAARLKAQQPTRIMVLDSLMDPHNVGAIIRSSLASGAAGVIVTQRRSAPLGGTVAKASSGAISHIDICQVPNLCQALQALKEIGFWIFGAVTDTAAVSLYDADLTVPACLVVGSEGKGIRPIIRKECDFLISIPMAGNLDSLNGSVAAAVILFEARRQNLS